MLGEHRLLERMRSMKHYFLLDQGDLYVNFMDLAEEELQKEVGVMSKDRVDALLAVAVQSSVANRDPFKDDVTCSFAPYSMVQVLTIALQSYTTIIILYSPTPTTHNHHHHHLTAPGSH